MARVAGILLRIVRPAAALAAAALLPACGGDGANAPVVVTGSVGDGPVVFAQVTVTDAAGRQVARATSNGRANYSVTLPADTHYPVHVEVSGGTDVVTNAGPDFRLAWVLLGRPEGATATVNANPFTTLIAATASAMPGGLSTGNVAAARRRVLDSLGMGFDEILLPDPLHSPVTADNAAMVVARSEALGEVIRRTRGQLSNRTDAPDADAVVAALAGDLADGALDGPAPARSTGIASTRAAPEPGQPGWRPTCLPGRRASIPHPHRSSSTRAATSIWKSATPSACGSRLTTRRESRRSPPESAPPSARSRARPVWWGATAAPL